MEMKFEIFIKKILKHTLKFTRGYKSNERPKFKLGFCLFRKFYVSSQSLININKNWFETLDMERNVSFFYKNLSIDTL